MGSFYNFSRTQNSGFCLAALNLGRVVEGPEWEERIGALLGSIQACPRRPGGGTDPAARPARAGKLEKGQAGRRIPAGGGRRGTQGAERVFPDSFPHAPGLKNSIKQGRLAGVRVGLFRARSILPGPAFSLSVDTPSFQAHFSGLWYGGSKTDKERLTPAGKGTIMPVKKGEKIQG